MTRYYVDSNPIRTTLQRAHSNRAAIVSYSWHVRDREQIVPAPYGRYGKSVACSKDELTARRICDMMNGGIPDGRDTNFSAAEVVKLIGERGRAQDERDEAKHKAGLERLRGDMLRDELADARKALQSERDQMDILCQRATGRTLGVTLADYITHCEYTLKYTREQSSRASAMLADLSKEREKLIAANADLAAEISRLSTNIYAQQPQVGKPGHAFSVAIAERNRLTEELAAERDRAERLQRDFDAADAKLSKIWDVINTEEP
jgi:chromosome segregation ATPase